MTSVIGIISAIGVLTGLYFAYRQRRNERLKMRHDAYPRRVAVFKCTEEFLSRAWTGNYHDPQRLLRDFHHCKRETRFLFGKKMADYLDYLYDSVEDHFTLEMRLEIEGRRLDVEAKQDLESRCFASRHWLGQENMRLTERFAKHLDLASIK